MAISNKEIALSVLKEVGGKENIINVIHCMTRLRFTLKDKSIPNDEEIKKIKGVLGVNISGDQYQVIIGQNVGKVYNELCDAIGMKGSAAIDELVDEDLDKEKLTVKSVLGKILDYLSGSMVQLIPAMMGAALFKTLGVILGPDMLNLFAKDSSFILLCNFIYNGLFYFMPIFLGFSASKKIGLNPIMGAFAAGCLLVPDFTALAATKGATFNVYGIPARLMNYGQTVLPILMIVPMMKLVWDFINKHINEVLSTIFTPFLTMIVMVPFMYCILGPLGGYLGDIIGKGLLAFGSFGGFVAVAIVGAIWEFLVITGMHPVLIVFVIANITQYGVDSFVSPAALCATFAAFGMAFGSFLRMRDKDEKALALGYTLSGLLGGVTEPSLYGIGFKFKKPFVAMVLGGGIGGLYAGLTHVGVYVAGATNILAVLGYVAGGTPNLINGCLSCVISFVATTILTYIIGFNKDDAVVKG